MKWKMHNLSDNLSTIPEQRLRVVYTLVIKSPCTQQTTEAIWAARYHTGLISKLMPKGIVCSFPFLFYNRSSQGLTLANVKALWGMSLRQAR